MKVSKNQSTLIDTLVSIITTWKNTNDISSPTHEVDISEYLYADLCDIFTDDEIKEIEYLLTDLLWWARHAT